MSCKIDEALVIVNKVISATKNKDKKEALIGIRERMVVMKATSEASMQQTKTITDTQTVAASTSDYTFTKEKDGYIVTNNTPNKTFIISGGSARSAESSRKGALYPVTKFNGGIDSAADSQELLVHIRNSGVVSTADVHELEQVNNKLIAARTTLFNSKIEEQKMAKDRWLELAAEVLNLAATLQNLQERIIQKYMLPSMKLTVNIGVNSDPVLYERIPQRLVKDPKEKQAEASANMGYTGTPEQLEKLRHMVSNGFMSSEKREYRNKIWRESNDNQKRDMLQTLEGSMDKKGSFNTKTVTYAVAAEDWNNIPFAKSPNADKTIKKPPVLDFKEYFSKLEAAMDNKLDAAKLRVSDVHTVNMVQSLLGLDTDMESFGMFNPKTKEVYYPNLVKFMEVTKGVDGLTKFLYSESKEQIESDEYRDYLLESFELEDSELTNKELFAMFVEDTVDTLAKSVFEQSIRLHEKIHGVVYDYVKDNPESVEAKYIDKLYKAMLNLAKKKPKLFVNVEEMADGTMYWQTDIQEFITEATTNPELVKVLASVDMEGNKVSITESLLDKLVKLMRKIVGLDNSIHTKLLSNILAIAEKQQDIKSASNPMDSSPTVLVNANKRSNINGYEIPLDSAAQYIEFFSDTELVAEGIKKWGSKKALVAAVKAQVAAQKGEAYGWWKKFSNWVNGLFYQLDKKSKEELVKLVADASITRMDLHDIAQERTNIYNKYLVSHVFKTIPELNDVGTQDEYLKYIKTVFPESKVQRLMSHRARLPYDKELEMAEKRYALNRMAEHGLLDKNDIEDVVTSRYASMTVDVQPGSKSVAANKNNYGEARIFGHATRADGKELRIDLALKLTEDDYYALRGIEFKNSWWEKGEGFNKDYILSANNGTAIHDDSFKGFSFSGALDYDYNIGHASVSNVLHPIIAKLDVTNVAIGVKNIPSGTDAVSVSHNGIATLSELIVKEPEQIHILGSKKDINTFKKWKNKQADTKSSNGIMDKAKAIGAELGLRSELVNETITKLENCSKG